VRPGTDEHLTAVGFEYFFTDAHQAAAGTPLGTYHDVPLGAERFDAERHDPDAVQPTAVSQSPYRAYDVAPDGAPSVRAFVRDPRSSMQVWSRHQGYPGDEWYLEFHKIRWPGGLKLWRVTGPDTDLGDKQPYVWAAAAARAEEHARHFASLLAEIGRDEGGTGDVIVAPFDTELFGHWWFVGVDFLSECYRRLTDTPTVHPRTASDHLAQHRTSPRLGLAEGSWGAGGDHRMWMNDGTRWTWERLWPLEQRYWAAAPKALTDEAARPILAQATREMLLAQSSDWQFIISTGAVVDYAEERFDFHCTQTETLLASLERGTPDALAEGTRLAAELEERDGLFPDVLTTVAEVASATSADAGT
jgi:1,4-alpha-glucan branching enzyme